MAFGYNRPEINQWRRQKMVQINDVIGVIAGGASRRAKHAMAFEYDGLDAANYGLKWTQDGCPQVWDVVATADHEGVEDAIVVCYDRGYGSLALLVGGWAPATSTEDGGDVNPTPWIGSVQFGTDTIMAGDYVAINKNTWGGNFWLFKGVDGLLVAEKLPEPPVVTEPDPKTEPEPAKAPQDTPPATETKPETKAKATVKDKDATSDKAE
ncbi:hypothetical protein Gekk315_00087 [Aeromonas phage Gekk3-15]